jgi:hypothetical protein
VPAPVPARPARRCLYRFKNSRMASDLVFLPPLDRQVQWRARLAVMVGWSLLAGLVRAVAVVTAGVLTQYRSQVPFAEDEHPVGALCSCGAHPSLGMTVRARGPRRSPHYGHALAGEDRVEGSGELGVAVPDEEAERRDPVAEVHKQVAGLLGSPCAVRAGGHAQDVRGSAEVGIKVGLT